MNNYPTDDCLSIMQGSGDANLDIYYSMQFVQNEEIVNTKKGMSCVYKFEHTPVVPGTVCGWIHYDHKMIYNFCASVAGLLTFQKIGTEVPEIVSGTLDHKENEINIVWEKEVKAGQTLLVVCYEFSLECQAPKQIECPKCQHKFYEHSDDPMSLQDLANGDGTLDMY